MDTNYGIGVIILAIDFWEIRNVQLLFSMANNLFNNSNSVQKLFWKCLNACIVISCKITVSKGTKFKPLQVLTKKINLYPDVCLPFSNLLVFATITIRIPKMWRLLINSRLFCLLTTRIHVEAEDSYLQILIA